ncbi:DUF4334 domain-containing protein [Ramlibacter sp. USB13]|uniref:DUF4334 domain-containing protein n=1 Tax=Ramlibacter cellulosilyticus TaxID=2764187 RepID=A0A923MW41_9BURK|nr:DUF4334 domain-containing protein [Ramlibacter cellulosilyticus]MBC5785793.1 DUF4334 domain-containing protein [Ramlibacter cellulosilyticus]
MNLRFANADEALRFFDSLPPMEPEAMLGPWAGEEVPTGHPLDGALTAFGWHGKRFASAEHVHPLVFGSGARTYSVRPRWVWPGLPLLLRFPALQRAPFAPVVRALMPLLATRRSRARLRAVRFRGCVSAAMVYDEIPVQDVFRGIDGETVLGLMDMKGMAQPFFFALRREPPA